MFYLIILICKIAKMNNHRCVLFLKNRKLGYIVVINYRSTKYSNIMIVTRIYRLIVS